MVRAFLLMLSILALASPSFAKTESGSVTAQSVVAYGAYGSTIVPVAVDADGYVYVGGSPTLDGLAVDGYLYVAGGVGIGTTTANAKSLNVDGDIYANNLIVDKSIYTTGATSSISGSSTIAISPGISIAGTGNSGFGTSTPSAMLDVGGGTVTYIDGVNDLLVKDAVEVDGNLYVDNAIYRGSAIDGSSVMQIRAITNGYRSGASVARADGLTQVNIWADTNGRGNINVSNGASPLILNTGSSGFGTGNVGIGTSTTVSKLTISGALNPAPTFINALGSIIAASDIETDTNLYVGTGTLNYLTTAGTGQGYFGTQVEVDGRLYVDGNIYFYGSALTPTNIGNIRVGSVCKGLFVSAANTVYAQTGTCP